jgi:hypothetical protein
MDVFAEFRALSLKVAKATLVRSAETFCARLWETFDSAGLIEKDSVPTLLLSTDQYAHIRDVFCEVNGIRKDAHLFMCNGVMIQEDKRD